MTASNKLVGTNMGVRGDPRGLQGFSMRARFRHVAVPAGWGNRTKDINYLMSKQQTNVN